MDRLLWKARSKGHAAWPRSLSPYQIRHHTEAPKCVNRIAGRRGELGISRKPLRREGRIVSANLWRLRSCASFCVRGYGCLLSTRLSLRPLTFEGHLSCNSSGALTPRECEVVPRHCEERSDEAIQSCRPGCI